MSTVERAARAVFSAMQERDWDAITSLVTPDFVDHGLPPGTVPPGPAGYVATLRWVTESLGIRYELHDLLSQGDRVAIRATAHGVHSIDFLVPATGRPYVMPTMHIYRGEGNLLAEHWAVRDEMAFLVQIGAFEPLVPTSLLDTVASVRA